ncbi:putative ankyrin repeat-containing protein [Tripterygium wilfordii]|uniref:Putative ankyrin repeat-containing protein n=1 Tax=Tripterygium wilfordii TaxID=458696 RepID=A0A7J7D493_TRIWF|nr:death-associated protein kinase 1-like [Tripterygium wilfordii]KAF5741141.1 putative ankyrin repeat-containing protein [Tripterygium wilfordii]
MPPSYFPLRWESTGDQWWYASPIDWAAANGHYDLVRELLHLDTNLLIKLTSLRRIRRLETVWDDEAQFEDVAKCRSRVAKMLLLDCETKKGHNSLIRAGYGGWLLYTAASAGDVNFVKELLERNPLLVFGEGEFGVTDILYAAARSKDSEVFRVLLDHSYRVVGESESDFRWEMMNRAVHAAARGGNLEILKELHVDCSDVLVYRDAQGATLLHSASGRGQIEVVKELVSSYDIITATDDEGNTALHIAAYRGYLATVEVLIAASPSLSSLKNKYGDTFLHMAVSSFRTPGFRRVDRQIELVKELVSGKIVNVQDLVNAKNNDGRTALHIAVTENVQASVGELLMTVPSIDFNIRDINGMTPLDLLKQRPKAASSEILIKQLILAGGLSNGRSNVTRIATQSNLRGLHGIGGSPGTSFRIPDAEIFRYTGCENISDVDCDLESIGDGSGLSEFSDSDLVNSLDKKQSGSVNHAAKRLKFFLRWRKRKEKSTASTEMGGFNDSFETFNLSRSVEDYHIALRQRYSKQLSFPSPSTRKKFTAGLMQGVFRAVLSPGPFSRSSMSSPASIDKQKGDDLSGVSSSNHQSWRKKQASFNKKLMNQYFCFNAQGLAVEDSIYCAQPNQRHKQAASLVA